MSRLYAAAIAALMLTAATPALAQLGKNPPPATAPDITGAFKAPTENFDYVKRTVMIPMRDGVKLNTVIVMYKGTKDAPILMSRTPYNASSRGDAMTAAHLTDTMPLMDEEFLNDGYIRVYQDIRGKYGSEGEYIMNRPIIGPLNDTKTDHTTDTYDTIDWLVKNIPETNGKVGIIGSSYDGFTSTMALINPHPALKAAVPQSPMIDGWMGDDWFQNGAFRQRMLDYFQSQTSRRGAGSQVVREGYDEYENFRRAGSAGDYAVKAGFEQLPFWRKVSGHPAYDEFWSEQALDKILAKQPLKVPTMWMSGIWDQEDIYGASHTYLAVEPKDTKNDMNYYVRGPWRHSGVNYEQRNLGPIKFPGDTATAFRREVLKPFLDEHLKTNGAKANTPPVYFFETGMDRWQKMDRWPMACDSGCQYPMKKIYLTADKGLSFDAPKDSQAYSEYVSDPANPVPYNPRPVSRTDREAWQFWLISDQRHVDGRPDVLTYMTEPLKEPLHIAGAPLVDLIASTTGTDSDFAVKLIDVYPDTYPRQPELGGYEMPVGIQIFRGRYRESFSKPMAITANKPLSYHFPLPDVNHVFLPGHRIMVQVQSSLFPLYDRNPQTFVENIFFAKKGDYKKATQRVYQASSIALPVVPTP
jgi:putative CocE/NonD family hydrolase